MAQVVPASDPASKPQTLSLTAQLELAAAARAAERTSARAASKDRAPAFALYDRRVGLRTRKSFREAVAILQAELVG